MSDNQTQNSNQQQQVQQDLDGGIAQAPKPAMTPEELAFYNQTERAAVEQSKYVKIQSGQSKIFKFDPKKAQIIEREWNPKTDGQQNQQQPQTSQKKKAVQYTVVDINDQQEKILTLSLSWALNLNELLKTGYRNIKVSRRGAGLDTSYNFIPL